MQFKVLAHHIQPLYISFVDLYYLHFVLALFVLLLSADRTSAQVPVNGQVFTNGLAILDSPAPQSQLHAGSNMSIAIDISGDGKLPQSASNPGSGLPTGFDTLEIYLLSYQTCLNVTVSAGTGLLAQEAGSTVKHLDWPIPSCIPAGQYNLTLYESSHINNQPLFTVTPTPIQINNSDESGSCTKNAFQYSSQVSSPPPMSAWSGHMTDSEQSARSASSSTYTSSGMMTQVTSAPGLITITLSASEGLPLAFPTVTVPVSPMTVTVVYVSLETVTASGQTDAATSIIQLTSTETRVIDPSGVGPTGFVPVNAALVANVPLGQILFLYICTFLIVWCV